MKADRGQILRWLSTGVIGAGVLCVVSILAVLGQQLVRVDEWLLPALTVLVAVANAAVARVRIRSTTVGATWTDVAIVVCIVWLPAASVPLCVFSGVLLAKLVSGVSSFKSAYNASKDALSATAGLLVALAWGVAGPGGADPLSQPLGLLAVAATIAVVEHAIGVPVLSLASATPWPRVLRTNGDIKLAWFVGKLAVTVLTIKVSQVDLRLLAMSPPVALCLHMIYVGRVRARTERAAWQRLAATAEELNDTDLATVLGAAVVNAARLFAADTAEVYLRDGPDGPLLVRGDQDTVTWSGDPNQAPLHQAPPRHHGGQSVTVPLAGPDLKADLGQVRLHYAGQVTLTERERLILRTFVSALRTAVRNAAAYAEVSRLALRNAHAALHDPLTGLANRRKLRAYGDEASRTHAVVVIDLDHFHEVNETLGHLAGDRLLVEVGRRLGRCAGPGDVVARLGGDEFAMLLTGPASAERRARQLLGTLDAPVDLGDDLRVRVEASVGVAALDGADGGMVELLRRGDVAMYQAKRTGARVVRYDASRDTADLAQLVLGGDLPRAVAEGEFAVLFQPIVNLETGEMISAEALARWHHPERGDLDPSRFLGAVERSGLLSAFAEVVLDQALEAMLRWRAAGVRSPVAVNASPRSLLDPGFPQLVVDRLGVHGVAGADLIIELTEALTLSQLDMVMVRGGLADLRDAGVRLALDDFGTGYSFLGMLAKVPVYELKIDRSFVAVMQTSAEAAAVVRSNVELGRRLGLLVVAEGVEHAEQRELLQAMGCPAGQGHLFARPMTIDALLAAVSPGSDGVPGRLGAPVTVAQGARDQGDPR